MEGWWSVRRAVFLGLGCLALGLSAFNAGTVPAGRRVPYFIGGSVWAVVFFAVALRSNAKREAKATGRIPDWADSFYLPKFRDVGRREPERRRVITVTPSAVKSIQKSAGETTDWYVRVRIEVFRDGGGMPTGFRDKVEAVEDAYPEFDLLDDSQGVSVLVDRRSADYLEGTTLDWIRGEDGRFGLGLVRPPR
jgi:Fe-S cluster assembly iron-binding protein IscA